MASDKVWTPLEDGEYDAQHFNHQITVDRDYLKLSCPGFDGGPHDEVEVGLPEGVRLCRLVKVEVPAAPASDKGLDFPDGPGWWAFDGYRRVNATQERLQELYNIVDYKDILDEDDSPYPAFLLRESAFFGMRVWHGKYYPAPPEGIGGLQYIGKWYRLHMPWDSPAASAVPPDIEATIRETLMAQRAHNDEWGYQWGSDIQNQIYARLDKALSWLNSQEEGNDEK